MLALQILGPVALRRDGAALPLNLKKAQALLLLLARAGAVPRQRVVSLLWPDLDESTARRNLRRELARLREVGAGSTVQADGDLLALAPQVSCDAARFTALLLAGQPDEALAQWPDGAEPGLHLDDAPPFNDWWAVEHAALRALRRQALEASAAALEAAGALEPALQRIETLLADDPLQEQRHRDAMRLHAACGRREAALAQYARCRALLKTELDLEPMAETDALAAALRAPGGASAGPPAATDDAARSPPAAAPAGPVARLPELLPFVGRAEEVARLESAWRSGRTLVIEGEAGVGKSRLARDFAAAQGPHAYVRCRPGESALPFAAFTRALRALAGPTPDVDGLMPWVRSELARLLPELGPAPPPLQSPAERGRFIEACILAWAALSADSFDAVLMDDFHLADADSQGLMVAIAQRRCEPGDAPAPAGTTARPFPGAREVLIHRPELDATASALLGTLVDHPAVFQLSLAPLPADAVRRLVQQLSGARDPARFAARLQQATAGNPFFIAETLRHLAEQRVLTADSQGIWHTDLDDATQDYRELPVPASVHEAVLARVRRLPDAARRVLEAAALAGEPFAPGLLAPACALSELDAVLAIEQALQARLLREHEAGGFAFAHDLVQQSLDRSLAPDRRRLVHRRLALGAQSAGAPAAVIAVHHEASGDAARAVAWRLAAGEEASRLHALPQAIAHWQQGLADGPTPAQALRLLPLLMRATHLTAQMDGCLQHTQALRRLADEPTLPLAERRAAQVDAARYLCHCDQQPEALALLDSLPPPPDGLAQARTLIVRADVLRELGRIDEAVAAARAALAGPALPDRERGGLLSTLGLIEMAAGRYPQALAALNESTALCQQVGDDLGTVRGLVQRGSMLHVTGDLAAAEAELLRAADLCQRFGMSHIHRSALFSLCAIYSDQTRPDKVLEVASLGWALRPAIPPGGLRLMYRLAFVDAHAALGHLGAALAQATSALMEAPATNERFVWVSVMLTTLELLGVMSEHGRAAGLQQAMGDETLVQMRQHANDWWSAHAKLALLLGDLDACDGHLARMMPTAEVALDRTRIFSTVLRAELALARGDAPAALAGLPAPDSPGYSDEIRLRVLAVRLAAEATSGAVQAETASAARLALAAPQVHAMAALYLHRAMATAQRAGVGGVTAADDQAAAAFVRRLADSLQCEPDVQARFLRRWA